jgi:hypothetical protein
LQGQRLIDEQLREKSARDAKLSPLDKAYAALEAARTFGSGILATVGSLPTRAIKGEDAAQEYINQRMYIPTTEKGMDYVGNVGNFFEQLETKYKLPPVLPEAVALQNVMGPAAKQATKQAAKAAKPVVGKALEDYMFKQGLALPATVYHGSPHKFEKFDSSKIGTGEGAQAYGHGLYLAESPDVAIGYQKRLSDTTVPSSELSGLTGIPKKFIHEQLLSGMDNAGILQKSKSAKIQAMQWDKEDIAQGKAPSRIEFIKAMDEIPSILSNKAFKSEQGQLYKVDLPDETIAKMLDWDKPLSQQAPGVRDVLEKLQQTQQVFTTRQAPVKGMVEVVAPTGEGMGFYKPNEVEEAIQNLTAGFMRNAGGRPLEGGEIVERLERALGRPEAASVLKGSGIPGIRYLDADSRAAGKGTSNFVVFPGEEDALTILERNQQPIKKQSTRLADNPDTMMMEVEDQKFVGGGMAKKIAKTAAKAVEKELALPSKLPRAKPRSKEDLRPLAQEMAEATRGDFYRPEPSKSVNPAGKSFDQWKAEQSLVHDIRPTAKHQAIPRSDIEKQKGMVKMGISGDTTVAEQVLHEAGPYALDIPSPQHGGALYGLGGEGAWASNNPIAATVQKRINEISQAYGNAPVLGQYMQMGKLGSDFALHFADANLRAIDLSKMSKDQIEMVNELIRKGSPKSGPRPSFPGIEDKESAYLHFAIDPEIRKHFNAIMQKPTYTESLGLPDGRIIHHAITEPELRNLPVTTTGFSQMELVPGYDPEKLLLSEHPTYSHVIPGNLKSPLTRTQYHTPAQVEFSDVHEYLTKSGPRKYDEKDMTRMYQTSTPRQIIDQQHIDEIRMFEELMKEYGGKKKGGAITKDQKFVGGGIAKAAKTAAKSAVATRELEKQAVLRAEAAAKSAAKQALMPQYNEAVKGQTQKQKPLSFEQWKSINYPEGTQGLQNAPQKQTFKYPQEEAMRLAQQRAALPIEQGGLGLPANNTPEQRAKAMGISTDAYHGTKQDITGAFKPGYDDNLAFVTKSPEFASKWIGKGKLQQRSGEQAQQEVKSAEDAYREIKLKNMKYDDALNDLKGEEFNTEYDRRSALARAEAEAEFGSRGSPDVIHSTVYPLKVEANRTFNPETDMDVMAEFFEKNEIPPKVQDLYASGNYMMYETKPVVAYLKSKGYDSMRLRESTGDDYPTIAVFNPETTRSRFAAFDSFRKTAATAAAMGVAAPDLLAEENKANGGSVNLDAMYMAVNDAKFRRK